MQVIQEEPLKRFVLPNGLRLVTYLRSASPLVAARLYLRAGSRYDGGRGIAHFVEHAIFSGTKHRSADDIHREIESIGGVIQANTTREYITLHTVTLCRYLDLALDVMADLVTSPLMSERSLIKEKLVILQEIERAESSVEIIWDTFAATLWKEHPLRNSVLGRLEDLKVLKYSDVLGFFKEHFCAENVVLSVCGGTQYGEVFDAACRYFGDMHSGEAIPPQQISEPPPESPRQVHIKRDIAQTHLLVGFPTVGMGHNDKPALKLLDRILGTGRNSRLYRKLRLEKGLVYNVYSAAPMYEDAGYFCVYTSCSVEKSQEVIELILNVCRELKTTLTEQELEDAKNAYEGALARNFETNLSVASINGIEELLHKIEPFDECIRRARSVSIEDITRVAETYLDENRRVEVKIGPGENTSESVACGV